MRKINSAKRLIEIFSIIQNEPSSLEDITKKLSESGSIVNKETVLKYFRTLRKFGCKIRKISGKFHLKGAPFSLDLNFEDYEILSLLENVSKGLYGEDTYFDLKNLLDRMVSMSKFEIKNLNTKNLIETKNVAELSLIHKHKIAKLIKYGYGNSKVNIVYLNQKMKISQIMFKYYKDNTFVHVFNEDTKMYELLLLDNIREIKSSPEISIISAFASSTVFALSGRLKKSYTLHEGERVISIEKDRIVVANNQEDKVELLKRLTRYSDLCEIISPKKDVEDFKIMVDKMYKNLVRSLD